MLLPRPFILILSILLFALTLLISLPAAQSAPNTPSATLLARADRLYAEGSAALAIDAYRLWLRTTPATRASADERARVACRMATALGKAQRWEEAFAALDTFEGKGGLAATGLVWRARAEAACGVLFLKAPHDGYQIGPRFYRGEDYPHTASAIQPLSVNREKEDQQAAQTAFETAVSLYEKLPGQQRASLQPEIATLYFDLARLLPVSQAWEFTQHAQKTAVDWHIDPASAYRREWPTPKKVLKLYARLATFRSDDTRAVSGMQRALYVRASRDGWRRYDDKGKQDDKLPLYDRYDARSLMEATARTLPNHPQAPQMWLIVANWQAQEGDLVGAAAGYRALRRRYPNCVWETDAREALRQLTERKIELSAVTSQSPGQPSTVNLHVHNLRMVTLRAYPLDLSAVLLDPKRLGRPDTEFTSLASNFKTVRGLRKVANAPVATWTVDTEDTGDYQTFDHAIRVPLLRAGAYAIVATGDSDRVRAATLLLITDLAIVRQTDARATLCLVANAVTGKPIAGAAVTVREVYYDGSQNRRVKITRGVSDEEGIFRAPRVSEKEIGGESNEVFAALPGSRYALTASGGEGGSSAPKDGAPLEYRGYIDTDRPVYRPGQHVNFRALLAARHPGNDWKPVAESKAHATITSPHGAVLQQDLTVSAFGSVNGGLDLPRGAALGEYSVYFSLPGSGSSVGGTGTFRVEEYRKPEFQVVVTPNALQARFGDKVAATVKATFYAGGPVRGGTVAYRVLRRPYTPFFSFPRPYDGWMASERPGAYRPESNDDEFVTSGTATLSGEGTAKIVFPATHGTRDYSGDYEYAIAADVTDASRRVVTGNGLMKVTNTAFDAFLDAKNSFYRQNENIALELRTQDANGAPVAAQGHLTIYRLAHNDNGDSWRELIHRETLTTDARGAAFTSWRAGLAGDLTAEFVAQDRFGAKIVATQSFWVEGGDLSQPHYGFFNGDISLIPAQRTYPEGGTAQVLVVTKTPNDYVLLTEETGDEVLSRRIVHIVGRSATVAIPIVRAHVPNFHLIAVGVRNRQFLQADEELFVPPVREFAHIAVTADRAEYRPGEQGIFTIHATDDAGHPVAAETSLALFDASVLAIQKSYAPEIRSHFYGDRRAIEVETLSSDNASFDTASESDDGSASIDTHGIHLPDAGNAFLLGDHNREFDYNLDFQEGGGGRGAFASVVSTATTGRITGQILDESDHPVPGVAIRLSPAPSGKSEKQVSDAQGQFAFRDIPPGIYRLQTEKQGFRPLETSVTLDREMAASGASVTFHLSGDYILVRRFMHGYAIGSATVETSRVIVQYASHSGMIASTEKADVSLNGAAVSAKAFAEPTIPEARSAAPPRVRSFFPDTAFWTPSVVTDAATGEATVHVTFPDTLTTWKAAVWGATATMQVGAGEVETTTNKRLIVRLAAPRFLVERDRVTLSVLVRNDLPTAKSVHVTLSEPDAAAIGGAPASPVAPAQATVEVPAGAERRVDFPTQIEGDSGGLPITLKAVAETDTESDATLTTIPTLPYGVEKFVAQNGEMAANDTVATIPITLPHEREPGSSALLIQLEPSLAATTLDALPYLETYPYGCVEQTMSRFLPAVLVAKSLGDAGVDLPTLRKRAEALRSRNAETAAPFGQLKPNTDADDPQAYTYPVGAPGVLQTPALSVGTSTWFDNPVFDTERLRTDIADGLARLASQQHADGGWGWWPDDKTDAYMTAYVVGGLAEARDAGAAVPTDRLARGAAYLIHDIPNRADQRDLAVWELYALAAANAKLPDAARNVVAGLFATRDRLSPYGQSLLALALQRIGATENARIVCRNLRDTATIDRENGTANWRPAHDEYSFRWWWDDETETDAWALRAFTAVEPKGDLAPLIARWLVRHKHGNSWESTKTTALTVAALTAYARAVGEFNPHYSVTVAFGDKIRRSYTIDPTNALLFDNRFVVPDTLLADGPQSVTIEKTGTGRLYWSASLQYQSTEARIAGTGPANELHVERRYYRLTPKMGSRTDYDGSHYNALDYTRTRLADNDTLRSGDLIETELIVDAKNDYDYVVIEDRKPAGCEPLEVRSGARFDDGLYATEELRDTKIAFFIDHLRQGTRVLRYRSRAETPGEFHALPTNAYACYAPEVRALGDSQLVRVGSDNTKP